LVRLECSAEYLISFTDVHKSLLYNLKERYKPHRTELNLTGPSLKLACLTEPDFKKPTFTHLVKLSFT